MGTLALIVLGLLAVAFFGPELYRMGQENEKYREELELKWRTELKNKH